MSLGVRYLLQSNFSACARTMFALSVGSFVSKAAGPECSGARVLRRNAYASPSYKWTRLRQHRAQHIQNMRYKCLNLLFSIIIKYESNSSHVVAQIYDAWLQIQIFSLKLTSYYFLKQWQDIRNVMTNLIFFCESVWYNHIFTIYSPMSRTCKISAGNSIYMR